MDWGNRTAEILKSVREKRPLIHHITNFVVMNETANITLAAGGRPVMTNALDEAADMARAADALVLNIGTLFPDQVKAMLAAGQAANEKGIPVILDPVGAGATKYRTDTALMLLKALDISIVRANASEALALTGETGHTLGVDGSAGSDPAAAARALSKSYGLVAAITGAVDAVAGNGRILRIDNGHPMMADVTGTGCMATSVAACFAAAEPDSAAAAAAALDAFGTAGKRAARNESGPGSFHVRLYDELANLSEDMEANVYEE